MTLRSARSTCASRRTGKRWVYGASTTGIVLGGCPGFAWNITPNLTNVPSFRSALLNPRADVVGNEERRRLILLHQQTVSTSAARRPTWIRVANKAAAAHVIRPKSHGVCSTLRTCCCGALLTLAFTTPDSERHIFRYVWSPWSLSKRGSRSRAPYRLITARVTILKVAFVTCASNGNSVHQNPGSVDNCAVRQSMCQDADQVLRTFALTVARTVAIPCQAELLRKS